MTRICLLALIGLPGAGKTRLSNWLLEHQLSLGGWNVLHFCYDDHFDITSIDHADYKTQRQLIFNLLAQLINALNAAAAELPAHVRRAPTTVEGSDRYLIICDDNHYYRSMRYKLYQMCRSHGCLYAQIYVATNLAASLLANVARGKASVPANVINQMHTRLEPPSECTVWERNSLSLSYSDFPLVAETITQFIQSLLVVEVDVAPLMRVKEPQLQSPIHELDLQLRARIRDLMGNDTGEQLQRQTKQMRSRALIAQRQQILTEFRNDIRMGHADISNLKLEYYVNMLN